MSKILLVVAFVLLLAGVILQLTGHDYGIIFFLVGAVLYLVVRIIMHRRKKVKEN